MTKKEQEMRKAIVQTLGRSSGAASELSTRKGRTVVYMFPFSSEGVGVSLHPKTKRKGKK